MSGYTVGTLFSGIGVPDLAAELHGMRVLWQVEIDDYCQRVLARHFPHADRYRDIHGCHALPYVDVITAGFPCQPFSVAGNQRGSSDERFLVPEMMRVIDEVRPRICLLENVPGFAALHDGAEFKSLLRAFAEMGYDAEWGHLRASDVGAPHRRERWWLVSYATGADNSGNSRTLARATRKAGQQNVRAVLDSGGATVVNTGSAGLQERNPTTVASAAPHTPRRPAAMADSANQRLNRRQRIKNDDAARSQQRRTAGRNGVNGAIAIGRRPHRNGARLSQSGMGRGVDGSAGRLDFVGWPAAPGQPQHDDEPPRITTGTPDRAKRLKALGNAWVFPLAYELLGAVGAWLEAQDLANEAAA